jgi:hypothetical protein
MHSHAQVLRTASATTAASSPQAHRKLTASSPPHVLAEVFLKFLRSLFIRKRFKEKVSV